MKFRTKSLLNVNHFQYEPPSLLFLPLDVGDVVCQRGCVFIAHMMHRPIKRNRPAELTKRINRCERSHVRTQRVRINFPFWSVCLLACGHYLYDLLTEEETRKDERMRDSRPWNTVNTETGEPVIKETVAAEPIIIQPTRNSVVRSPT